MMLKKWALIFLCFSTQIFFGADWISPTTPEDWNTAGNWSNPASPPTGQNGVANFTQASPPIPASPVVRIATTNTDIGTINIDSAPAQSYTFAQSGAGTLRFNVSSSSANINVSNTIGNGAHTFSVPIALSSSLIVTQGSTGTLTFSGAISGSGGLTKEGSGTLALTVANSYSGATIIDAGKLSINGDDRLGTVSSTPVTISGGILEYSASATSTRIFSLTGNASIDVDAAATVSLNGVLQGSGSLTKADSGTLTLTASNTYQGGTNIAAGTLSIASNNNLGNSSGALNFGNGNLTTTAALSIPRSGTISGNSSITSSFSNTFSGSFSGAGSLAFLGGGTFTLTGSNSYSGGTTIGTSTNLVGTTSSLQRNITMAAASSLLRFNQNFNGTYSGSISGAGTLDKLGTGTVFLSGSSPSFSGATTVSQGTLVVNGSFQNSNVSVSPGAALGGLGRIGTTVVSGGINPGSGSTIGTLRINGTLTLNAGASTQIDLAPLQPDLLSSTGAASITGPLRINPIPGFYGFSADYTILTSSSLSGTFSSLSSSVSGFVPSVSYTGTDVLLHIDILEPFAVFPFSNVNTEAVGNNIDALFSAGELSSGLTSIFNEFVGQSIATINEALDQMHPAPYSAFVESGSEIGGQLISSFKKPFLLSCSCTGPHRFWIEGLGNSLTVKNHGIQLGFQSNSGGIIFGYDRQCTDSFSIGLGGAWVQNHLDWQRGGGKGEVNGFYGGLYLDNEWENFYFGASFLVGPDFYDTTRKIHFLATKEEAKASFSAIDLMTQLRFAYLFGAPQAFFYPYANLDYLHLITGSFEENGAGALNLSVQERSDGTLRTELGIGLQVEDTNFDETMCIAPTVSLGWVNMSPLLRPKLKASFEGASIPFSATGWDESWNLFNINFGLAFRFVCFDLNLNYNVEFSPDSKTTLYNQHGSLLLGWRW